ncbi:MAG: M91 family zinc metallopeptidase [Limisphaerales bacterium]
MCGSMSFMEKVNEALKELQNSKRGKELYDEALNSTNTLTISEGENSLGGGDIRFFDSSVWLNPESPNFLSSGQQKASEKDGEQVPNTSHGGVVVLAHEMGHAAGYSDDPNNSNARGNNILENENPVRDYYHFDKRTTTSGASVYPRNKK